MTDTTILVRRDADTGALSWKHAGVKGSRWRGRHSGLENLLREADKAGVPLPRLIDYVPDQGGLNGKQYRGADPSR